MAADDRYRAFQHRIYEASHPQEILNLLSEAELLQDSRLICTDRISCEFIADAFRVLQRMVQDDIGEISHLVMDYLLPLLDLDTPEDASLARSRWRDILVDWLNGLSMDLRVPLRDSILDHVQQQLEMSLLLERPPHPESACWTISSIGYRRDNLIPPLWQVVKHFDDERGDIALSTLTKLGLDGDSHNAVLVETVRRAQMRRSRGLISALHDLADPSSVDIIKDVWLKGLSTGENSWLDDTLTTNLLARIADVADNLSAIPIPSNTSDRVWQSLVTSTSWLLGRASSAVFLGSNLAPAFNTPRVVRYLLNQLATEPGADEGAMHRRYLLYLRLSECVRPRQLLGWTDLPIDQDSEEVWSLLQQDALQDTGDPGSWATSSGNTKEYAWQTALRWHRPEVLKWYEKGILDETNLYVQRNLCEVLSAFRIEPTPKPILDRINQELEVQSEKSAEVNAYIGSLALARSSATKDAFDALRKCGIRIQGDWLLDAAQSLAAVSVDLVRQGNDTVVPILFDQLLSESPDGDRTAAAVALEDLAAYNLLDTPPHEIYTQLTSVLSDPTRSNYQRALLIMILGHTLKTIPPDLESNLVAWAREDNDWLGWISLGTLAQFGRLALHVSLIEGRLGLTAVGDRWDLQAQPKQRSHSIDFRRDSWYCGVLASLYRHDPYRFTPAFASCVGRSSIRMIGPLLRVLEEMYLPNLGKQIPARIRKALIRRLQHRQEDPFSETDIFSPIVRLASDRFVAESWSELVINWDKDARAAFAVALGQARYSAGDATNKAIEQILSLHTDGQYKVRRAAYRALALQSLAVHRAVCSAWAVSQDVELRQRAAEACAWLFDNDVDAIGKEAQTIYATLRADRELQVRDDAFRARQEARYRVWARYALAKILETKVWNNEVVLELWPYGEGLTRTGNDDAFSQLRAYLRRTVLPQHVREWLNHIVEAGEKHWKGVEEKWPKPWELWRTKFQFNLAMIQERQLGDAVDANAITWQHDNETQQGVLWSDQAILSMNVGETYRVKMGTLGQVNARIIANTPTRGIYLITVEPY